MQLRKATRQKAKIRLHLSAPSGGGKTYSAILIAQGLADADLSKVAIIDTENGSADLYEHLGEFNVLPLQPPYNPERYIEAIKACEEAGMEVIIIDSISHEWEGEGGILRIMDTMTGDSFSKWKVMTPRHDAFIQKILNSKCHIITTVRRKQEYAMIDGDNGKKKVEKLGLKEVTREGIDYEMTVVLELDINQNAYSTKDRTGLFMGKPHFTPSTNTGRLIAEWCENGQDIGEQVREAIAKLENCTTLDEVLMLRDTVPLIVTDHPEFKAAGNARYSALKVPPPETVTPLAGQPSADQSQTSGSADQPIAAGSQSNSTDHQPLAVSDSHSQFPAANASVPQPNSTSQEPAGSQDQPGEFNRKYESIAVILDLLSRATRMKDVTDLYFANQTLIEDTPDVKPKFSSRKADFEGQKLQQDKPAGTGGIKPLEGNGQADADKAIAAAIEGAKSRPALQSVYKEHKATIDTHNDLSTAYNTKLETFPKPGPKPKDKPEEQPTDHSRYTAVNPDMVAAQRSEDWFKARMGKTIWMQGGEGQFTGPHPIETEEHPGWMVTWQNNDGFTYRDLTEDEQAAAATPAAQAGTATTDGEAGTATTDGETAGAETLEAVGG